MTKSSKKLFSQKSQSQGHKVIDLGVIWKGIISWVCKPNKKFLSLTANWLEARTNKYTNFPAKYMNSRLNFIRPWAAIYPLPPPGGFCKGIFIWKPIQNEPC